MNKKALLSLLLCSSLLVMLVGGCSGNNGAEESKTDKQIVNEENTDPLNNDKQLSSDQNLKNGNESAVQAPMDKKTDQATGKEMPGVWGQVKSIDGNTISLAVAEMPQRQAPPPASPNHEQEQNPEQRPEQPDQPASPELTGETMTISIDEDVKIISGGRDSSKEISITDIKKGDLLEVWFTDEEIIEQLRVMQALP